MLLGAVELSRRGGPQELSAVGPGQQAGHTRCHECCGNHRALEIGVHTEQNLA